MKNIGILT